VPKVQFSNKILIILIILITGLFLFPVFWSGLSGVTVSSLFYEKSNGFSDALIRTFSFAIISAVVNVLGGFYLALLLSKISLSSRFGKQLSYFILPITLGNIAVVFVFKVLLFNSAFFNQVVEGGFTTQNAFLIILQFWQYGFLFAYLFWLSIQNINKRFLDYANAAKLTRFELIRDFILPQTRNLFILLLFIGFIFSFYEDAKSQLIFRASQGLGTELINHWLYRDYQSALLINPVYATQSIFKTGLIVFVITALAFLIIGILALLGLRLWSKINISKVIEIPNDDRKKDNKKVSYTILFLCNIAIFSPLIAALIRSKYLFAENISLIIFPLILTMIAAFAATTLSIVFGIASRLAFHKWLNTFNSKSLFYFLAIFLLLLIPPLCIVLAGFKWFGLIGYHSNSVIYIVWVIGHCFLTLPILGSFVIATHFIVKENEIEYLFAYHISNKDMWLYSFFKRFKAEYALTLLFAFSFIWNDAGLNMILSDKIPSFAANLQMLFIGRAADYSKATTFVLVAVALSVGCILIWNYIVGKAAKINES